MSFKVVGPMRGGHRNIILNKRGEMFCFCCNYLVSFHAIGPSTLKYLRTSINIIRKLMVMVRKSLEWVDCYFYKNYFYMTYYFYMTGIIAVDRRCSIRI